MYSNCVIILIHSLIQRGYPPISKIFLTLKTYVQRIAFSELLEKNILLEDVFSWTSEKHNIPESLFSDSSKIKDFPGMYVRD